MGNSESSEAPSEHQTARRQSHQSSSHEHRPPSSKRQKAPLGPATSTSTSTSTVTTAHAHADISTSLHASSPKRSRPRSVTTTTPRLSPQDISSSHKSDSASMGNDNSKPQPRPPSRSNTLSTNANPPKKSAPTTQEDKSTASPGPKPVEVPPPTEAAQEDDFIPGLEPSASPYGLPPANYSRPPRLPLPIEEEIHAPGSPIHSPQDGQPVPQDAGTLIESGEVVEGELPRKSSVLSSTVDDDDIGDNEAFATDSSRWGDIRVPTKLEWAGNGEKVFVTGTFCNWEKKMKLHKNKDGPGFSAVIQLPPGTHHLKFLVDGEMITSTQLPTTVDWTNILVNYIEVAAPLPSGKEDDKQAPAPAAPMPIPGAAVSDGKSTGTSETASRPSGHLPETQEGVPSAMQGAEGHDKDRLGSISNDTSGAVPSQPSPRQRSPESRPHKPKLPRPKYTNTIPDFLIDLDNYNNPEDERYQRAQKVAGTLPQPPSLPMFLSKSILNGVTPHKDDASVLILPNHTVLNHLATSSIKNGVLATSGTTRYKKKFLTTIMYKPTSDDN